MSNLRSSIYGLLGHPTAASDSELEDSLESIRAAMLELLGPQQPQFAAVMRRIRYAGEVQGLWYLRGDLMAAVATVHGEGAAREQMRQITNMFRGLVPAGLHSRPGALGS